MDCSQPQAEVLIGVMGYDANSMPLKASEDEKASCGGILADEIQLSLTGEETFDLSLLSRSLIFEKPYCLY